MYSGKTTYSPNVSTIKLNMEDRILETHVIKWMKSVEVIDASKDRFEQAEWQAYTTIRNIFGKNRPNMELLANSCNTLKEYLDAGVKDKVFTAVRDLLKTTEIARENFQAFKELLEDRDFFARPAAIEGASPPVVVPSDTAVYRRVESNGYVYEGMFLGDERVWKGKITYPDGSLYDGEWDNNGPHGEGVLTQSDGTRFAGRFDGLSGNGRIDYSDHTWFEGPWNENGPNGYGTWHYDDRTDIGEYRDGCRVGSGRLVWNDGNWYEGGWNDNGANGQGTMRVGTRTDRGEYRDGCRVGSGRMEWDNGDWYEGEWNDNGRHGQGTQYVAAHQRTDTGQWDNDHETGHATMKWSNGNTYRGTWSRDSRGNLNGEGEYYTASTGKTRSGKWVDGSWKTNWATPRNIFGVALGVVALAFLLSGNWLVAIVLAIVAYNVYEGK